MDPVSFAIAGCVVVAVVLLFHHRYHHRTGGPAELHGTEQWFQCSDVGNLHSCSHEMWILGFLFVAAALAIFKTADAYAS